MTTKSRTKKKTTWILLLALAFSGLIAGGIWYYINKSNHVKSELADFILANPEWLQWLHTLSMKKGNSSQMNMPFSTMPIIRSSWRQR